jgi:myosin heavy subunit
MEESVDAQIKSAQKSYQQAQEVNEKLTNAALQEQILSLHQDKLKLLGIIRDLKSSLHQQKDDTTDIYYYLNKKCDENYEVIGKLESQLITEQVDREQAEKLYQKKISDLETAAEETVRKYQEDIALLEDKFNKVNDYHHNLEENEKMIRELRQELKQQEQSFLEETTRLERKLFQERENMKNEYEKKVMEMKAETIASIEKKLEARSKDTLLENYLLKNNLHDQSIKTEEVLELSNQIIAKDKKLQIQLKLSKSAEDEFLVRVERYQRIIKSLNEKISNDADAQRELVKQHEVQLLEKDDAIDELSKRLADLEDHQMILESNQQQFDEVGSFLAYHLARLRDGSQLSKRASSSNRGIASNTASTSSIDRSSSECGDKEPMLIELISLLVKKYPKKFLPHSNASSSSSRQRNKALPPIAPIQVITPIATSEAAASSADSLEMLCSPLSPMESSLATDSYSFPEDDGMSIGSNSVSLTSTITHEETNSLKSMPARLYPGYLTYNISHKFGDLAFGRSSVSSVASDGKLSRNQRQTNRVSRKAAHQLNPLPQYLAPPRSHQQHLMSRNADGIGVLGQSYNTNTH